MTDAVMTKAEIINQLSGIKKILEAIVNKEIRTREEIKEQEEVIEKARKYGGSVAADHMRDAIAKTQDQAKQKKRQAIADAIITIAAECGIKLEQATRETQVEHVEQRASQSKRGKGRRPRLDSAPYIEKLTAVVRALGKGEELSKKDILAQAGIEVAELNAIQWGNVAKASGLKPTGRGPHGKWTRA
jgi:hypothetical protein